MSSLYTTKSLGRTWLPSPVRNNTRARFGTWPQDPPKLRWRSTESQGGAKKWSKTHERFALSFLVVSFGVWWSTCGSTSSLSRKTFHLPAWTARREMEKLGTDEVAYVTYASNTANLCSAVMQFESLHRLGATAQRVLLFPKNVSVDGVRTQLLRKATTEYGVSLQVVDVKMNQKMDVGLLAANQTAWKRVMIVSLDSTILQRLDEEFFVEQKGRGDGAAAVILSPSKSMREVSHDAKHLGDILAKRSTPVRRILQTSELRQKDHSSGSTSFAKSALGEANLVHFSDGAPWKPFLGGERERLSPSCAQGQAQCESHEIWQSLYNDFRARRTGICGPQFNEWEVKEAQDEANRRIIPLQDRVNGVGGNSGAV